MTMKTALLLPLTLLALSGCDDEATVLNTSPAAPSGGELPGPGGEQPGSVDEPAPDADHSGHDEDDVRRI